MTKCNDCMFMCIEKTNEERIKCKDFITPKDNEKLKNQNKELIQKISELEVQIEKMKCCGNCKHLMKEHNENCVFINSLNTICCNKWELRQ